MLSYLLKSRLWIETANVFCLWLDYQLKAWLVSFACVLHEAYRREVLAKYGSLLGQTVLRGFVMEEVQWFDLAAVGQLLGVFFELVLIRILVLAVLVSVFELMR